MSRSRTPYLWLLIRELFDQTDLPSVGGSAMMMPWASLVRSNRQPSQPQTSHLTSTTLLGPALEGYKWHHGSGTLLSHGYVGLSSGIQASLESSIFLDVYDHFQVHVYLARQARQHQPMHSRMAKISEVFR